MKHCYPVSLPGKGLCTAYDKRPLGLFLPLILFLSLSFQAYPQEGGRNGGGGGGANKDIVVRACTEAIGNGLYRVNFGYDNPNKKEVTVDENGSYVISGKNKNKSKGPQNFKAGSVDRAFTMEFHEKESVEWTVINPSGRVFTVTASANSSKCPQGELGFIFPVFGQGNGKNLTLIGSELTSLSEGNAGDSPSEVIYQINASGKVLIEIIPQANKLQDVINLLTGTFGLQYHPNPLLSDFVINPSDIEAAIDAFFPISRLQELNSYPLLINFARPLYKPLQNSGIVRTQGDSVQYSSLIREAYRTVSGGEIVRVNGKGIKLGVISDSFDTQPFTGKSKATVDVENGDLPGTGNPEGFPDPVEVVGEYPYGSASDEGRAMLQLIHDVAPAATLAFSTGILSPRQFEQAISALEAIGCDAIVDDITFTGEPMFGISNIGRSIQSFTASPGNYYFTSAGNFANNGVTGIFTSSQDFPQTNFIAPGSPAVAHVYGANPDGSEDLLQRIRVEPGVYMLVLQWAEGVASQENSEGALSDLDLYLVGDNYDLLVGNNRINVKGDPTEYIVFRASGSGEANIMITSANGPPPPGLAFRLIAYRANGLEFLQYGGAPTVSGHAMTQEAITVGAVDFRQGSNPVAQPFSSYAGALPDNSQIYVDLAAPDGGNTNVASIGQDISFDADAFPNFFGTSAAAPHAAGAFALLLSALPSWYPDGLPAAGGADPVLQLFKNTATPAGDAARAGSGLIQTARAFQQIAAQTARLTSLVIEDGKTPSAEPLEVTILGDFFPEDPKVIFDGEELEITAKSDGEIRALVGTFTGNPALYVETNAITPGGTDGGLSNPLYFFEGDKIALNILAEDVSVEFGQSVAFSYTVEGLPEGTTLESLGLPEISFTSPAVFPFPDVNNYLITPGFSEALTPEQEESFQVNFINGKLEVTKKDLIIKPDNASFTYGEPVEISLQYLYDAEGIEDNAAFLEAIRSAHQSDFYTENTLILINKLRAVVNEQEILDLLTNGSWMASEKIVQNKLRAVVNGMNLVDLEVQNIEDYRDAVIDPETNKLRAVVNKLRAVVNGQDLLNNLVDLVIENKLRAVVNETGLGDEDDKNDYSATFALIDAEDGSTETEERGVEKLYAMSLVSGLEVTTSPEDRHTVFPGAFLASIAANFNVTYQSGLLEILPATLQVTTGDLLIGQGQPLDTSRVSTAIDGYVYGETFADVFPDGLSYLLVDSRGNTYEEGDTGAFFIRIAPPQNYTVTYEGLGVLYVTPTGDYLRKVRTYLDCVEFDAGAPDGLTYTANFRYENPNEETIYVLHGPENRIVSDGPYEGDTPIVFLPGEGTFEVRFTGSALKWELTTLDSTHKSATSSSASASSNKCPEEISDSFVFYPNPVSTTLFIDQSLEELVVLEIFDLYGIKYYSAQLDGRGTRTHTVDVSTYPAGLYFARITTKAEISVYSILKQ